MKVTRERKILCGVMVAGLLALVIDRSTGSGADQPSPLAEAPDSALMPAPTSTPQGWPAPTLVSSATTRPTSNASLSGRIAALARADLSAGSAPAAFRDPFHVPKAWADNLNPAANLVPSSAARFESAHRLTAVVLDGRHSRAVIDGSLLRLGQSIGGHTLVAVTQDLAVLECGNSRVLLKLDRGGGVATADAR